MNLSVKNFIYISETGFEIHRTGGEELATFEECLAEHRRAVERFIKYRLQSSADAEDLLQEVYLTAYRNYDQLKNPAAFKAWIISIARNSCNAYFRRQAEKREVSLDFLDEAKLYDGRWGASDIQPVRDTIALLSDKDQQILSLYYWEELPQREIARRLSIPVGTVKSRLYSAKQNFKNAYPFMKLKGDYSMKKLPQLLPPYQIEWMKEEPFSVKWEELMGWFLIPKQGEKLTWGIYDILSRKTTQVFDMEVIGKAMVHGIEGVEITAKETHYSPERKPSAEHLSLSLPIPIAVTWRPYEMITGFEILLPFWMGMLFFQTGDSERIIAATRPIYPQKGISVDTGMSSPPARIRSSFWISWAGTGSLLEARFMIRFV